MTHPGADAEFEVGSTSPAQLGIDSIESIQVIVPLKQTFGVSHFEHVNKACLFVRVQAGGLVGETYAEIPNGADGVGRVARIIDRHFAEGLRGADALRPATMWALAHKALRTVTPHDVVWGRMALGCLDAALWDLVGKAAGQPLWRLWGGARSTVPVLRIGGYYGTDIPDDIASARAEGVAGMKFKVGGRPPEIDAQRTLEAAAAAGDGFHIAPDANRGWTVDEAIDYGRAVSGLPITWFEEPTLSANYLRDWHYVGTVLGVPICGGQNEIHGASCLPLLASGSIGVCNFDAPWGGGPTEWLRVAKAAELEGLRMAHHQQPQVAAHLIAAVSNGTFVETFSPERDPVWWTALTNRPEIERGAMKLTDEPGFGWVFDWDWLKQYAHQ